eukprot:Hpha_TRINITY_DN16336_c10_g1::TRINITY_DN16336_c10_g1_i1::g.60717::m.60717
MPRSKRERFYTRCAEYTVRDNDSPEDAHLKRSMTPVCLACLIATLSVAVQSRVPNSLSQVGGWIGVLGNVIFLIGAKAGLPPRRLLDVFLGAGLLAILAVDVVVAGQLLSRSWSCVVIILDATLVFNAHYAIAPIITFTLLYLLVERFEAVSRFGLYDWTYWGDDRETTCNCSEPPCTIGIWEGVNTYAVPVFVLLVDFHLTRTFASGMRSQMAMMQTSVRVSERVAHALSRYHIDEAQAAIEAEGEALPEELRSSFQGLVYNLNQYKPFLPSALLREDKDSPDMVQPPCGGGEEVRLTMVFTDIQSSTMLWESHPQEMQTALETHNRVIREVATSNNGYECKVIGDSFMLAFEHAEQAVEFGLEAQVALVRTEWPQDLCLHPLCAKVGGTADDTPLWYGVRVRIAMHTGDVRGARNPLSGRFDYFGSTVNIASRVEGALRRGGLTGVTEAVMEECSNLASRQDILVAPLGEVELRGVAVKIPLFVIMPSVLVERIHDRSTRPISPAPGSASSSSAGKSVNIASSGSSACSRRPSPFDPLPMVRLSLTERLGSVAVVRARLRDMPRSEVEGGLSELLAMTEVSGMRTQGVVVTAVSSLCVVVWNASKPCATHVDQCALFVGIVCARDTHPVAHLGVASGMLLSGNISGDQRRFATVIGESVELCLGLSDDAEQQTVPALLIGAVGEYLEEEGSTQRTSEWRSLSNLRRVVHVFSRRRDMCDSAAAFEAVSNLGQ